MSSKEKGLGNRTSERERAVCHCCVLRTGSIIEKITTSVLRSICALEVRNKMKVLGEVGSVSVFMDAFCNVSV